MTIKHCFLSASLVGYNIQYYNCSIAEMAKSNCVRLYGCCVNHFIDYSSVYTDFRRHFTDCVSDFIDSTKHFTHCSSDFTDSMRNFIG